MAMLSERHFMILLCYCLWAFCFWGRWAGWTEHKREVALILECHSIYNIGHLKTPLWQDDVLVTTAPKFIAVTCVFMVALAMVLSLYYLMQKRHSRHHGDHDPLPPGEVAIRHGHGREDGQSQELGEILPTGHETVTCLRLQIEKLQWMNVTSPSFCTAVSTICLAVIEICGWNINRR